MSDEETSHIMFLKEQILRFAAPIIHRHKTDDIDGLDDYAPKQHASSSATYGAGNKSKYGHVMVKDTLTDNSTHPVQGGTIKAYVDGIKTSLEALINNKMDVHDLITEITNEATHNSIPSTRAVWNALVTYTDLERVDLAKPKEVDARIDNMITPGYYRQTGYYNFKYGGETIFYKDALVKVEKQFNGEGYRMIQHVYATSKITVNGQSAWKLNGSEYTRWGTSKTDWKAWHVAHKPYTKSIRVTNFRKNVEEGSVEMYENTAGFIIHWNQSRYNVYANQYEYTPVCHFEPALPISGQYVFGNVVGKLDIRITSGRMDIRTTVPPGGYITGVNETFFVPRNQ